MSNNKILFARIASLIGFFACIGDIVMTAIYGFKYPNYSQLHDTMSKLGATDSPVGFQMSLWWVLLCFLFIIMAFGFKQVYYQKSKSFRIAFWLIVIYALGEGLGSGIFPADHIKNKISLSLIIHDSLGGIGIAAIMILPFILLKTLSKNIRFYHFSKFILIFGPAMLILFTISKIVDNPNNHIVIYKGLWQRLLMLNYYLYLMAIAKFMWSDAAKVN